MSVYTHLTDSEMTAFFARFQRGGLREFKAASEGVENTNYFLLSDRDEAYVLTIFEDVPRLDLPFFLQVMRRLASDDLPVPSAYADRYGIMLHDLKDKPAVLFPRLPGKHPKTPTAEQCRQIGSALGRMHYLSQYWSLSRPNPKGLGWIQQTAASLHDSLPSSDQALLDQALADLNRLLATNPGLSRGIIHGDLFHDNALYQGERLTGIIDFYNACNGFLLYDLAIVVNDWCGRDIDENNEAYQAVLNAYQEQRAFTDADRRAWPVLLQAAALRFWLSRQWVVHENQQNPEAPQLVEKDPVEFRDLLEVRLQRPLVLP